MQHGFQLIWLSSEYWSTCIDGSPMLAASLPATLIMHCSRIGCAHEYQITILEWTSIYTECSGIRPVVRRAVSGCGGFDRQVVWALKSVLSMELFHFTSSSPTRLSDIPPACTSSCFQTLMIVADNIKHIENACVLNCGSAKSRGHGDVRTRLK